MTASKAHGGDGTARREDRYVELRLESGAVVIYDADNPTAWVQSDAPVELSANA